MVHAGWVELFLSHLFLFERRQVNRPEGESAQPPSLQYLHVKCLTRAIGNIGGCSVHDVLDVCRYQVLSWVRPGNSLTGWCWQIGWHFPTGCLRYLGQLVL